MSTLIKTFVLKHVFKNVSSFVDQNTVSGEEEEHFGVPWKVYVVKENGKFGFYLNCLKVTDGKWTIETAFELKVKSKSEKSQKAEYTFGSDIEFVSCGFTPYWESMKNDFLDDDKLTVEAHVTIVNMTGFYKGPSRLFDDSAIPLSDMLLTVGSKTFRVSKLFLASQATYFKTVFLETHSSSTSLTLPGIDSDDFQKFLEVLYGEPSIDESNVDGILLLCVSYTARIPKRRCEDFLIEKSKKSLKKKLQLSKRYGLASLKAHCLNSMKTIADVASVIPSDLSLMDRADLETLFQKMISFK